jgi:hypothetical protein
METRTMSVIRAHFDGKVFVPDEPVDVPQGTPAQILVVHVDPPTTVPTDKSRKPLKELAALLDKLPDNSDLPPDYASELDHYLYGTPKHGPE